MGCINAPWLFSRFQSDAKICFVPRNRANIRRYETPLSITLWQRQFLKASSIIKRPYPKSCFSFCFSVNQLDWRNELYRYFSILALTYQRPLRAFNKWNFISKRVCFNYNCFYSLNF